MITHLTTFSLNVQELETNKPPTHNTLSQANHRPNYLPEDRMKNNTTLFSRNFFHLGNKRNSESVKPIKSMKLSFDLKKAQG